MSDYINKVAEAVRGATIDCAWKFGARTVLRKPSLVDLAAIIASVPRPEPVAAQNVMLMEALHVALDALDSAKGNINPERGFADEVESEVVNAYNKIQNALSVLKDKKDKDELYDADPTCKHVLVSQPGGGVKCKHCGGWFCY